MSMNIYAKNGDKVIFDHPNAGYGSDQEWAAKHLKVGEVYTVDFTDVHSFSTDVYLKEFTRTKRPIWFNSVMFSDYKGEKTKSAFDTMRDLINSKNIGDIVKRKELMKLQFQGSEATIDNYRNQLTCLGYLEIAHCGEYKILKKIPSNLTTSKLRKEYTEANRSYMGSVEVDGVSLLPICKQISSKTIGDSIIGEKPMTIEEAAKGRKIKPYPQRFDSFASYEQLKDYLIELLLYNKIFKHCDASWMQIQHSVLLPISFRKDVYFSSVYQLSIDCTRPPGHVFDDIRLGGSMVTLNPGSWNEQTLQRIIDEIKVEIELIRKKNE